ncbi:site-2 protease family protein, partial [Brachybacterium sp. HMSC06H03]|uniref:site-2 protease family protein n=1 Tax=Brachybacterium sp. HMSC06H03 TaxID=1581127 RepID=UPI001FF012D0
MPRTMLRIGALPPLQVSPATLVTVLLVAVLMFPSLQGPGLSAGRSALVALGLGLFLILSVLVHELAHALVARAFGARVDHIALTLWGGHTQYRAERMPAIGSVLVSLAGPASNGLLAAATGALGAIAAQGTVLSVAASFATWLNVVLALFNLLPGLPMDGGRALESLLGAVLRRPVLGTRITAWIGRAIAVGVVVLPLSRIVRLGGAGGFSLLTLLWALLIAGLLWQGASRALEETRVQERVAALDAAALARPVRLLAPHTPL